VKALTTVLIKVLVREFYREHAAFFLMVIGLAFGFMSKVEHMFLAEFFISMPVVTLIPVSLWALYTARIVSFNARILRQGENGFLYNLVFVSPPLRLATLAGTALAQILPALVYGTFLLAIAFSNNRLLSVLIVLTSLVLLVAAITFALNRKLYHPNQQHTVSRWQHYLNRLFVKPQPLFFINWVARHRALQLLWSKAISCILLFGVLKLYTTDDYDLRLLGLGLLVTFGLSIDLAGELHRFNNLHLALLRQLPLSQVRRTISFLITWFILTLPETGLLVTRFPAGFGITGFISAYSFALSIPFLFYNLFYVKDWQQENIMRVVYSLAIAWFVLILFKIPLAVLAAANIIGGIVIWKRCWYTFEYLARDTSDPGA